MVKLWAAIGLRGYEIEPGGDDATCEADAVTGIIRVGSQVTFATLRTTFSVLARHETPPIRRLPVVEAEDSP